MMTLRLAIAVSFSPEVWKAVQNHLSPPELLKLACLEEFKRNSEGDRTDILRAALKHLDTHGEIKMDCSPVLSKSGAFAYYEPIP